jgi:hypothetical protein
MQYRNILLTLVDKTLCYQYPPIVQLEPMR